MSSSAHSHPAARLWPGYRRQPGAADQQRVLG